MRRVGLEWGEQPGVKLRLYSFALLCCRIASPACTVPHSYLSCQTQCRLARATPVSHRSSCGPSVVQTRKPRMPPTQGQQVYTG